MLAGLLVTNSFLLLLPVEGDPTEQSMFVGVQSCLLQGPRVGGVGGTLRAAYL